MHNDAEILLYSEYFVTILTILCQRFKPLIAQTSRILRLRNFIYITSMGVILEGFDPLFPVISIIHKSDF